MRLAKCQHSSCDQVYRQYPNASCLLIAPPRDVRREPFAIIRQERPQQNDGYSVGNQFPYERLAHTRSWVVRSLLHIIRFLDSSDSQDSGGFLREELYIASPSSVMLSKGDRRRALGGK